MICSTMVAVWPTGQACFYFSPPWPAPLLCSLCRQGEGGEGGEQARCCWRVGWRREKGGREGGKGCKYVRKGMEGGREEGMKGTEVCGRHRPQGAWREEEARTCKCVCAKRDSLYCHSFSQLFSCFFLRLISFVGDPCMHVCGKCDIYKALSLLRHSARTLFFVHAGALHLPSVHFTQLVFLPCSFCHFRPSPPVSFTPQLHPLLLSFRRSANLHTSFVLLLYLLLLLLRRRSSFLLLILLLHPQTFSSPFALFLLLFLLHGLLLSLISHRP